MAHQRADRQAAVPKALDDGAADTAHTSRDASNENGAAGVAHHEVSSGLLVRYFRILDYVNEAGLVPALPGVRKAEGAAGHSGHRYD
jgi:hypothetical protein